MEIFKDIKGFEGLYQVSNYGRVKSLGNGGSNASREKILKPQKDRYGYLRVNLCKEGKLKNHKIHRLVAQAFIPNHNNYPIINHKDENKQNNRVDNLEFCTSKYNNNYGTRNQIITNHPNESKKVLCVETGVIYPSIHQVERELGFEHSYISKCCTGRYKTAYKFHWKYVS